MDKRALPLCLIGVGIVILPFVLLFDPREFFVLLTDRSEWVETTFPILVIQIALLSVGFGVIGIGLYSYRSGNLKPALATYVAVVTISIVGFVGAQVEASGGPLVPPLVWILLLIGSLVLSVVASGKIETMLDDTPDS